MSTQANINSNVAVQASASFAGTLLLSTSQEYLHPSTPAVGIVKPFGVLSQFIPSNLRWVLGWLDVFQFTGTLSPPSAVLPVDTESISDILAEANKNFGSIFRAYGGPGYGEGIPLETGDIEPLSGIEVWKGLFEVLSWIAASVAGGAIFMAILSVIGVPVAVSLGTLLIISVVAVLATLLFYGLSKTLEKAIDSEGFPSEGPEPDDPYPGPPSTGSTYGPGPFLPLHIAVVTSSSSLVSELQSYIAIAELQVFSTPFFWRFA